MENVHNLHDCAFEMLVILHFRCLQICKIHEPTRLQSNIFLFSLHFSTERATRKCERGWKRKTRELCSPAKSANFIYMTTDTRTVAKTIVSQKFPFKFCFYWCFQFPCTMHPNNVLYSFFNFFLFFIHLFSARTVSILTKNVRLKI